MHSNFIILIKVSIKWWILQVTVKLIFDISMGLVFYLILISSVLTMGVQLPWKRKRYAELMSKVCPKPSLMTTSIPSNFTSKNKALLGNDA